MNPFTVVLIIFVVFLLISSVRVVQEYERGVVFRLGRLVGLRGPGLILLIPSIERMVKVDLRVVTLDVPAQEVITRDNVTVRVNAVVYFKVIEPQNAVVQVFDFNRATSLIAQTTLRSVLGQAELDALLSQRDQINQELQRIIDLSTEAWGVKVTSVEVRDIQLPVEMQRAMARQAEADREKRAKIIHAQGEYDAATQLAAAARVIGSHPAGLQLRYLQTMTEIATEKSHTVVFPLPTDLLQKVLGGLMPRNGEANGEKPAD